MSAIRPFSLQAVGVLETLQPGPQLLVLFLQPGNRSLQAAHVALLPLPTGFGCLPMQRGTQAPVDTHWP